MRCVGGEESHAREPYALSVARRYNAEAEINQLQWSGSHPDWVGIAFNTKMQILRV